MKKRYMIVLLIIGLLIAVICTSIILTNSLIKRFNINNQQESSEKIIFSLKQYLYKKYDLPGLRVVRFERANNWYHGDTDVLVLETIGQDVPKTITVIREKRDDKYLFYDNYFRYLIKDEFESLIRENANCYFKDFLVYTYLENCYTTDSINEKSTLEDFLEQEIDTSIIIAVNDSDYNEEEFNRASDQLACKIIDMNLDITAFLTIYSFPDDVFTQLDKTSFNQTNSDDIFTKKTKCNDYYLSHGILESKNGKEIELDSIRNSQEENKKVIANNKEEFKEYMQNIISKFSSDESYEVDYNNFRFIAQIAKNQLGFTFDLFYNENKLDAYEIDDEFSFSSNEFYVLEDGSETQYALVLQISPTGSNIHYVLIMFNDNGDVLLSKDIFPDNGTLMPIESYIN